MEPSVPRNPPLQAHLVYHMCLSAQWPLWMSWQIAAPWLEYLGLFVAAPDEFYPALVYLAPVMIHMAASTLIACVALGRRYSEPLRRRSPAGAFLLAPLLLLRVVPAAVVAAGMLPHQCCAWVGGILTPGEAEFQTTPKSGSVGEAATAESSSAAAAVAAAAAAAAASAASAVEEAGVAETSPSPPKAARPAVLSWCGAVELGFVAYHLVWSGVFAYGGRVSAACRIAFPPGAVLLLWSGGEGPRRLADACAAALAPLRCCQRQRRPSRVSPLADGETPLAKRFGEPLLGAPLLGRPLVEQEALRRAAAIPSASGYVSVGGSLNGFASAAAGRIVEPAA